MQRNAALPLALAVAGLAVAACAQENRAMPAASPPAPSAAPAACHEEAGQFAVGQPWSPALQDQLRRATQAGRVRVVRPGEMVTMEFDEARLTINIDAVGNVARVRCG